MNILLALLLLAVSITTGHFDNTRDGQNNSETILTPSNVGGLKHLWTNTLDGAILSQSLYVQAADNGTANDWVIVPTLNNSIYALNAVTGAQIWKTNFGSTWTTPFGIFYSTPIGIVSTPVIDIINGWIFLVSADPTPAYTLRKLSLSTGSQISSVVISGTYPGTGCTGGDHVSGGNVSFNATWQIQRIPLTLVGGNIYLGFGSGNEPFIWHGWVFEYNESLARQAVLNTSPNGCGAGVWADIATDGTNLYFPTGNGDYDGMHNFSQSILKTDLSLNIVGSFTPSNWSSTSAVDADVSSGKVMLILGTNYLTISSKDGRAWLIDKTNMCGLQGAGCSPAQVFTVLSITPGAGSGTYGGLFSQSGAYFPIALNPTSEFAFLTNTFNTMAVAATAASFGQVWASASSNSGTNQIIWLLTVNSSPFSSPQQVTLRARNPSDLTEYWNSGAIGEMSKFAPPTIANGRVFVSTFDSGLQAFGLTFASRLGGNASLRGSGAIK